MLPHSFINNLRFDVGRFAPRHKNNDVTGLELFEELVVRSPDDAPGARTLNGVANLFSRCNTVSQCVVL